MRAARGAGVAVMPGVNDARFMRLAVREGRRGLGRTSPNPPVAAVLVHDGTVVGRGYHRRAGLPHAEVEAVRVAGDRARGATLYVTLEPCAHHGRTPPCTEAILAAGVRRVVVGARDPNPRRQKYPITSMVETSRGLELKLLSEKNGQSGWEPAEPGSGCSGAGSPGVGRGDLARSGS